MSDKINKRHNREIIDQFSKQAIPFAEKFRNDVQSLNLLIEISDVSNSDELLDVACGPGIVACKFASTSKHITGIDITPKMIEHARLLQEENNLQNLTWQTGEVMPLPFPDEKFDIVLTRYSFHHFIYPAEVLNDMIRVCKKGGKVMVIDMTPQPEKAGALNRMEKLRDPSHVRALNVNEFGQLLRSKILNNFKLSAYRVDMELENQLNRSFPKNGDADKDKIRTMFQYDLESDSMGLDVHMQNGKIYFSYPITIMIGMK